MVTYYVVQAFQAGKNGYLVPDQAREAGGPGSARMIAISLAETRAGVVAFSRTGDPATGDWQDAEVIYRAGELPDELFAAVG